MNMFMWILRILGALALWMAGLILIYSDFIFAPLVWHSADQKSTSIYMFCKLITIFICLITVPMTALCAFLGWKVIKLGFE